MNTSDHIPSAELLKRIDELDVRIYGTSSGKLYIGELSQTFENAVELSFPAVLTHDTSAEHGVSFCEATPGNSFQTLALYSSSIEMECHASLLLKKLYCDYLTIARFGAMFAEEIDDGPTSICHLEPKGLSEDYWKYIASRLKP